MRNMSSLSLSPHFLHVMPMRRKAQAASLLAQLFERVRVQVIREHNNGVRRLHTEKGVTR